MQWRLCVRIRRPWRDGGGGNASELTLDRIYAVAYAPFTFEKYRKYCVHISIYFILQKCAYQNAKYAKWLCAQDYLGIDPPPPPRRAERVITNLFMWKWRGGANQRITYMRIRSYKMCNVLLIKCEIISSFTMLDLKIINKRLFSLYILVYRNIFSF